MFPPFQPLQLLLVIFAGWGNRNQLDMIEFLQEENRVLEQHLDTPKDWYLGAESRSLGSGKAMP